MRFDLLPSIEIPQLGSYKSPEASEHVHFNLPSRSLKLTSKIQESKFALYASEAIIFHFAFLRIINHRESVSCRWTARRLLSDDFFWGVRESIILMVNNGQINYRRRVGKFEL